MGWRVVRCRTAAPEGSSPKDRDWVGPGAWGVVPSGAAWLGVSCRVFVWCEIRVAPHPCSINMFAFTSKPGQAIAAESTS